MSNSRCVHFWAKIKNNTGSNITLRELTNDVSSPPVDSGNPPEVLATLPPGKTSDAIKASGGYYEVSSEYTTAYYPDTKGKVTYTLDNGQHIVISWKVEYNGKVDVNMGGNYSHIPEPKVETTDPNHYHYTWELPG